MRKAYPEATTHVVVGEVLEENPLYLRMRCRAFHFKRPTVNANITTSDIKVRLFPWGQISYVTELPDSSDWELAEAGLDEKGDVVLKHPISSESISLKEGLDG
ncbi:MAG TPA: hypothetical protein VMH22_05345 [bacterium]|nr:hypothetical protein [bacterium]